jgi:hypothetical protein
MGMAFENPLGSDYIADFGAKNPRFKPKTEWHAIP